MTTEGTGELVRVDGQGYALRGELGFQSVTALWRQAERDVDFSAATALDLQAVQRSDSAGVAFLLAWVRRARQQGGAVTFTRVPEQIRAIAGTCGVREILALDVPAADSEQQELQA
ncbi:STAS domain-containing protein [Methylonatrum kenyense]|uniref:STAS domain-containing protein n=1 Tax=Methylonatrum kenyense TaxID=455253 RepID=UPI0020BE68BE|nr:STAS domain-containing protein [Methylonatrum kenyense]MCK8516266.1 STAS domain-containing protein [Methylonatrum kenyense]